jgi:tRNA dimethylallyltransferase
MNNKIHIVFGPTASGKTDYALQVAQNFDSVIINGDSMQIYKEIPIITNQPTVEERAGVPHKLFGYRSILEKSDIAKWLNDAVKIIEQVLSLGKTPIVAGGTGMYLRALTDGVSEIPEIPEDIRNETRNLMDELGPEKFHEILAEKDPASAAKIKKGDSQRQTRAFEVMEFTGISIQEWNKKPNIKFFEREQFEIHFLDKPREEIYDNINRRFEKFVEIGALDEAKKANEIFKNSGMSKIELEGLPAYKAHGLRELISHLNGEISLEEAIARGQQVTRNYAKRQMTWWRNWMKS